MGQMGRCEMCTETVARYRCPGCGVRTCSLSCVRSHKEQASCSGERDRTKFAKRAEFNEGMLMSDIGLLEDVNRSIHCGQRVLEDAQSAGSMSRRARSMRERLRRQAKRNGVRLLYMPSGLSRGRRNTSTLRDHGLIFWRLELTFGQWITAHKSGLGNDGAEPRFFARERVSEKECIQASVEWALRELKKLDGMQSCDESSAYTSIPPSNLRIGLWAEKSGTDAFWLLDREQTLTEGLKDCLIIEFPRLLIARPDEPFKFRLVKDGDDKPDATQQQQERDGKALEEVVCGNDIETDGEVVEGNMQEEVSSEKDGATECKPGIGLEKQGTQEVRCKASNEKETAEQVLPDEEEYADKKRLCLIEAIPAVH